MCYNLGMEIIPAVDVIGGKCVRLSRGNYKFKKIYSTDPLEMAKLFERAGLKRLHLIDLEGAKRGRIKNWESIEAIAKNTGLRIQIGGGIRRGEDIKKLLGLGVERVILGSVAVKAPQLLKRFLKEFGKEKIVVDVGTKKGEIYFRGWQKKAKKTLHLFLKDLIKLGVKTIICTDIERDGALKGPNFSLYKKLVKDFPSLEIIASGGIRNKEDLKKLSRAGVQVTIVGKAIYENKIPLSDLHSN